VLYKGMRVFKTAWFAKAAKKASITDQMLSAAFDQILLGQVDDLGGGVFKKRLNKNEHRSIVLSKIKDFWVFEFVFAKKDRDNIDIAELNAFRNLAKSYAAMDETQLRALIEHKDLIEIQMDYLQ
jgi:hypothetical protein